MTKRHKNISWGLMTAWSLFFLCVLGFVVYILLNRLAPTFHLATASIKQIAPEITKSALEPKKLSYGFEAYKQALTTQTKRPKLVLIITDVGLQKSLAQKVIKTLPNHTVYAFSPYAKNLKKFMEETFAKKHEILLDLPIRPLENKDVAPLMLSAIQPVEENEKRLKDILSKGQNYIGVMVNTHAQLITIKDDIAPLLKILLEENLAVVDSSMSARSLIQKIGKQTHLPVINSHFQLTEKMGPHALETELDNTLTALSPDHATILTAKLRPLTLETLNIWLKENQNKFTIIPLSNRMR